MSAVARTPESLSPPQRLWLGYFVLFSLAAATPLLAWLLRAARAEASAPHPTSQGGSE